MGEGGCHNRGPGRVGRLLTGSLIFAALWLCWWWVRHDAVAENVLMRDDFVLGQTGNIVTHRLLFLVDMTLWQSLIGPDLLLTVVPKWIAGLYASLAAWLFYGLLRDWGIGAVGALGLSLMLVIHPIANGITLWNSIFTVSGGLALQLLGYRLVRDRPGRSRGVLGALLMALGIAGYQIYATVPVMLFIANWSVRYLQYDSMSRRELYLRGVPVVASIGIYAVFMLFTTQVLQVSTFAGRGLSSAASIFDPTHLAEKWHGVSNMLANVTQPALGYYLGRELAFSKWEGPYLILGVLSVVLGVVKGWNWPRLLLALVLPGVLTGCAAGFLLVLNVTPSGWRVAGPVLVGACLAFVVLLADRDRGTWTRTAAVSWIVVTLTLVALVPVTRFDAGMRVQAQRSDLALVGGIDDYWRTRGIDKDGYAVRVVHIMEQGAPRPVPAECRLLVSDFQQRTADVYSNLLSSWSFPGGFLRHHGIRYVALPTGRRVPPDDPAAAECAAGAAAAGVSPWVIHDDARRMSTLCHQLRRGDSARMLHEGSRMTAKGAALRVAAESVGRNAALERNP